MERITSKQKHRFRRVCGSVCMRVCVYVEVGSVM